jgi:hypothetical protein
LATSDEKAAGLNAQPERTRCCSDAILTKLIKHREAFELGTWVSETGRETRGIEESKQKKQK